MSGLARLLAGHGDPGVYRWHAAFDVTDVRRAAEQAGYRLSHLDGWTQQTKAEVLQGFGESLDFPDWYGRNLDALADCLADVLEPTVLLWDGWGVLARADQAAFAAVIEILADRARTGPVAFTVLLRGDGPEVEVVSLDG